MESLQKKFIITHVNEINSQKDSGRVTDDMLKRIDEGQLD